MYRCRSRVTGGNPVENDQFQRNLVTRFRYTGFKFYSGSVWAVDLAEQPGAQIGRQALRHAA